MWVVSRAQQVVKSLNKHSRLAIDSWTKVSAPASTRASEQHSW
jgi:hypothetical protein